ncbi:hypothetical protein REJC140_03855 [Pseudorhizobium endolithicum]|uniref:Uncharacterized protein n=1 Tax=Pseudorhizobium endolithicum TaxID=1191678 RepID=A0ABN7JRV0_9HYPH|nr:hypothetical protein [Pseudorhizobium endolithicum]CAD7044701.1 hypothetical protein REJC140_03855 [Pseudorhizobium endolithicum]
MSNTYDFQYAGGCLGRLIDNGALLSADNVAAIQPLDVVSIILKRTFDGPFSDLVNALGSGGHAGVVKLFLGRQRGQDEDVYIVGQLNPPCISPIPASAIEAMHKVSQVSVAGDLCSRDKAALALLAPFRGDEDPVPPIRPGLIPGWPATDFEELSL